MLQYARRQHLFSYGLLFADIVLLTRSSGKGCVEIMLLNKPCIMELPFLGRIDEMDLLLKSAEGILKRTTHFYLEAPKEAGNELVDFQKTDVLPNAGAGSRAKLEEGAIHLFSFLISHL